jgi:hypothetical protein
MNSIYRLRLNLMKILSLTLSLFLLADPAEGTGIDSLFRSEEVIEMELRSDFSAIQREREGNPEYHEGELIYLSGTGEKTVLKVKVMARGNFRLKSSNCQFPPLLVNFKKGEIKTTLFENQDKLKLVTPCQNEADLLDEYTVYKMYNQVTDLSFKVRLVSILYFDTSLDKALFEKYSFFIEDKDHVAERNNLVAEDRIATPFDIDRDNYIKLSLFQYLIGNKDWWVSSRKNIVLMQSDDHTSGLYTVPYDFDFSGFVNADYSRPSGIPNYSIIDRRRYKGICFTDEEFSKVFDFYRELRPAFESIISNQDLISRYDKKTNLRYIKEFYTVIDNKNLTEQNILNLCETRQDYNLADNSQQVK